VLSDRDDDLKEYDLEHYDNDAVDENGESLAMFGNARSLAYHESNADDPYITIQDDGDEDEEKEELQILASDNMLVAAKVEDEVAYLEIYVYEDEADNLYVHHDIMLPAIPLCVEWLDLPVGRGNADLNSRGNYVAVGTFDPDIELWDLDTIDCMYPNAILGQGGESEEGKLDEDHSGKKKKKRKKTQKVNDSYHVDAILSLAANRHHRNLLASSSADKTVKLWDLHSTKCAKSYSYHTDKVCSIAWHPKETTILLSGSYDRTIVAADMRAPEGKKPRWGVESDVESVVWDPHDPNFFYVTTENGLIHFHDFRSVPLSPEKSKPIWKLQAHDQAVSSFDVNPIVPGFLATGSAGKEVKLWNIQPDGPSMVLSRNLGVGKVFSTKFAPDPEVGFRLAVAGSKGSMQIWDTSTNAAVRRIFADKMAPTDGEVIGNEKIIGVEEDSSDSENEGGVEPGGADEKKGNDWESMNED
jgi:periodic tryptophan protein 1